MPIKRQPKGTPVGGQFAEDTRSESEAVLDDATQETPGGLVYGKQRKVADRSGDKFGTDVVHTREVISGLPHRETNYGEITNIREVLVNGEAIGYTYEVPSWRGDGIRGFSTVEESQDPTSFIREEDCSQTEAITMLYRHHRDHVAHPRRPSVEEWEDSASSYYATKTVDQIGEDTYLYNETKELNFGRSSAHTFLVKGDRAVAYIKYGTQEGAEDDLVLHDIETRRTERGQGYANELITALEKKHGSTMKTTGTFTPEGRAAFSGKMPLTLAGQESRETRFHEDESAYDVEPMGFVESWDILAPKFRL